MAAYGSGAVTSGAAGGYAGDPGAGTGVSGPRTYQNGQNSDAGTQRGTGAASEERGLAWPDGRDQASRDGRGHHRIMYRGR